MFGIAIVRPSRKAVIEKTVKASDRAWRNAIFGLGGSKIALGRAQIGQIDGQPLAVLCQHFRDWPADAPHWSIRTDRGLFAFAGPAAIYGNAGFGPAAILARRESLEAAIEFDPDPATLAEGLKRTTEERKEGEE